jgi:hypothetical protein
MPYPEVSLRLSGSLPPVGSSPGDADALTEPRVMRLRLPPVGSSPGRCFSSSLPPLPWDRAPGDASLPPMGGAFPPVGSSPG